MARKRDFEALKARASARPSIAQWPPPDITSQLRHLHARIEPPTPSRPYWRVVSAAGHYLGAGKTPERALKAAGLSRATAVR